MKDHNYYVYMITNKHHNVLYIGVTNNIERRAQEHREKVIKGFTAKYNLTKIVYYEHYQHITDAIIREKQLKDG